VSPTDQLPDLWHHFFVFSYWCKSERDGRWYDGVRRGTSLTGGVKERSLAGGVKEMSLADGSRRRREALTLRVSLLRAPVCHSRVRSKRDWSCRSRASSSSSAPFVSTTCSSCWWYTYMVWLWPRPLDAWPSSSSCVASIG